MALSYLKFNGVDGQGAHFDLDIGTNRFYMLRLGSSIKIERGLRLVDEVVHETDLREFETVNPFHSAFSITLPATVMTRHTRYVQAFSFVDTNRKSPAISEPVRVFSSMAVDDEWISVSHRSREMTVQTDPGLFDPCRAVAFRFSEATYGRQMFLNEIVDVVRTAAPLIVELLRDGNDGGGGSNTGQARPSGSGSGQNQSVVQLLDAVIEAIRQSNTPPSSQTPSSSQSRTIAQVRGKGAHGHAFSNPICSRQQTLPFATLLGPLLQNAPQILGPLLQQSPELLQSLVDAPGRLLNVIGDVLAQQDQAALERRQADQQHHQNLLTESGRNFLLLQQILQSAANAEAEPSAPAAGQAPAPVAGQSRLFSRSPRVQSSTGEAMISFERGMPITINGKPKHAYAEAKPINFAVKLDVPQQPRLERAIVRLVVKDADTMAVIAEEFHRLKGIPGHSRQTLGLSEPSRVRLPVGKDLLVAASFRYQDADNRVIDGGTARQLVFVSPIYSFKYLGNRIGASIPLADRGKYRGYWNKIWEGGARGKKRWEVDLNTKYYIRYCPEQDSNARVETRIQLAEREESEREALYSGRMKSGFEISALGLNRLLPLISHTPSLDEARLKAFRTDELNREFDAEAMVSLRLKGKRGETGFLWTYPEMALFEFVLNRVSATNENGMVTRVEDEVVIFPKPVSIHFVGEKTERNYV